MAKRLLYFLLIVNQSMPAFAQMNDIKRNQLKKTEAFMLSMENGRTDEMISIIDSSFMKKYPAYKDSLNAYSTELKKYLGKSELSIVIVYEHPGLNTFRCRYWKKSHTYFHIDLSYKNDESQSTIMMVEKIPRSILQQLDKDLIKWSREQQKNGVPTPPKNGPPKTSQ
jgi:hypothetical protein